MINNAFSGWILPDGTFIYEDICSHRKTLSNICNKYKKYKNIKTTIDALSNKFIRIIIFNDSVGIDFIDKTNFSYISNILKKFFKNTDNIKLCLSDFSVYPEKSLIFDIYLFEIKKYLNT